MKCSVYWMQHMLKRVIEFFQFLINYTMDEIMFII